METRIPRSSFVASRSSAKIAKGKNRLVSIK